MDGWFDSPIASFTQEYNATVAKWRDALAALDAAYAEFMGNRDYALSDDELAPRWNALKEKADFLESTIANVEAAISTAVDFIGSIGESIGLSGQNAAQGLGFLPVIPWAAISLITAGSAAIWALANSMFGFNVDLANKKIAEQNIINSQEGKPLIPYITNPQGGFLSNLSGTAKWVTIGLLGFLAYSVVKGERGGRWQR